MQWAYLLTTLGATQFSCLALSNQPVTETHAGWHGTVWAGLAGVPYVLDITLLSMSPFPKCVQTALPQRGTPFQPSLAQLKFKWWRQDVCSKLGLAFKHLALIEPAYPQFRHPPIVPVISNPYRHNLHCFRKHFVLISEKKINPPMNESVQYSLLRVLSSIKVEVADPKLFRRH